MVNLLKQVTAYDNEKKLLNWNNYALGNRRDNMIFSSRARLILAEWAKSFEALSKMDDSDCDASTVLYTASEGQECEPPALEVIESLMDEPCDLSPTLRDQIHLIKSEISGFKAS
jgi:hypothetical protein